jgi:hypothetical protein
MAEPKVWRVSVVQIVMIEAMEVLRSGNFTQDEITKRLPAPAMAVHLGEALARAEKVGVVVREGGIWKLTEKGKQRPPAPEL